MQFEVLFHQQVNKLEITTDKRLLAAAGNPQIRIYEVQSNNAQPVLTYDGHTTNVTAVNLLSPLFIHSATWALHTASSSLPV
jgi:hypothetical protein